MAYARYGRGSKYHMFWKQSKDEAGPSRKTKADEALAIWHEDHRSENQGTLFTYDQVVRMLQSGDFTSIAGFLPGDRDFLRPLLEEFVADVDAEYKNNS